MPPPDTAAYRASTREMTTRISSSPPYRRPGVLLHLAFALPTCSLTRSGQTCRQAILATLYPHSQPYALHRMWNERNEQDERPARSSPRKQTTHASHALCDRAAGGHGMISRSRHRQGTLGMALLGMLALLAIAAQPVP